MLSRGSMILSVTNQITGKKTKVIPLIKYQLPTMFAFQDGSRLSAAASVIPKSNGSSWPGIRFAENPPETPAKAAAIPAIGCLFAAANTTPARGISTT